MKLIPENYIEKTVLEMAVRMSTMDGFVAMKVFDNGSCSLIPPHEVYALSVKQKKKIDSMIKRLRKKK